MPHQTFWSYNFYIDIEYKIKLEAVTASYDFKYITDHNSLNI